MTEVVDARDVAVVAEHADMLQVGTRNMANFGLLQAVGESGKPVLLKRGMTATVEEWLMAAEYIAQRGNLDVVLCERGIRTFEPTTRNTLDISSVPIVQSSSHLPVIVDPSHAAGRKDLVVPLSKAAIAVGADGVIVDVHPDPETALCDGPQALLGSSTCASSPPPYDGCRVRSAAPTPPTGSAGRDLRLPRRRGASSLTRGGRRDGPVPAVRQRAGRRAVLHQLRTPGRPAARRALHVAHRHRGAAPGGRAGRAAAGRDRARPGPVPPLRRRRRHPGTDPAAGPGTPSATPRPDEPRVPRGAPPVWVGWVAGALAMLLVAGFGAWLLFSSFEEDPATAQDVRSDSTPTRGADAAAGPVVTGAVTHPFRRSRAVRRRPGPLRRDLRTTRGGPRVDANGDVVRYVAVNMQDGVPETAWRTPGDGTGLSLTFRFDGPGTLSEVGLINGYAKVARDGGGILDWYHGNRRLRAVEWTFDDGTVVTQHFRDTTLLQMVSVDKVRPSR